MAKKIVFVIKSMKMGGSRVSLISLLNQLSSDSDLKIDVIVMNQFGPLLDQIPPSIRLIKNDWLISTAVSDKSDIHSFGKYFCRGAIFVARKLFGYRHVYNSLFQSYIKRRINCKYDVAIGYQEGESNDLAVMIPAEKHCIYYHSNYKNYYEYEKGKILSSTFNNTDKIAFVTLESMKFFQEENPAYKDKCMVVKNLIPVESIINRANIPCADCFSTSYTKIISVGRVSIEKGYDRVVNVAKKLLDDGFRFKWIIIGGGKSIDDYRKMVDEFNASKAIIFVGEKKNPYQIVKQADILVLPSRSEAQPLAAIEGLILGKPFISTNFDSAKEILDQKCGMIVDNSEDGLYEGLRRMMSSKEILEQFIKDASKYQYSNQEVIKQFYKLL